MVQKCTYHLMILHIKQDFSLATGLGLYFFVTDFPDYSGATNTNVQIVHYETKTNGGANSPRKPVIACNKNFNQLSVATPTQTVGSNTTGNIFLPTYPGEQLFSSFGNPSLAENNNEGLQFSMHSTPDKPIQGIFSLKYLVLFTKCTNLCNLIHMYIKNDYPLIIKYTVANLGDIKLCLSPNVV